MPEDLKDCIKDAVIKIQTFVEGVTGRKPSQEDIAKALSRYFVLNEIKDHILTDWQTPT